jgi:hypothetical protein
MLETRFADRKASFLYEWKLRIPVLAQDVRANIPKEWQQIASG